MTIGSELDAAFQATDDEITALDERLSAELEALKSRIVDLEDGIVTPPPPPPPSSTLRIAATDMSGSGGRQSTDNPGWVSPNGYIGNWGNDARTVTIAGRATNIKLRMRYRSVLSTERTITIGASTQRRTFEPTTTAWANAEWRIAELVVSVNAGPTGIIIDASREGGWIDLDWIEIVSESGSFAVIPPPEPDTDPDIDPDIGGAGTIISTSEIWITDPREPYRLENRTLLVSGGSAGIRNAVNDGRLIGPGKIRWTANRDGHAIANSMGRMIIEGDVIVEGGPWDGCGIQSVGREFGNGEGFLINGEMVVQPRPDAGMHGLGGLFGFGASCFGMFGFKAENRRSDIKKLTVIGARNHVTEITYSQHATDGGGIHMGDMSSGSHHVEIDELVVRNVDGCGAVLFSSPRVTAHIGKFDGHGMGLYSGHPVLGPNRVLRVSRGVSLSPQQEGHYVSGQFSISSYRAGRITYGEIVSTDRPTNGNVQQLA